VPWRVMAKAWGPSREGRPGGKMEERAIVAGRHGQLDGRRSAHLCGNPGPDPAYGVPIAGCIGVLGMARHCCVSFMQACHQSRDMMTSTRRERPDTN
jgi:hypothetical protein